MARLPLLGTAAPRSGGRPSKQWRVFPQLPQRAVLALIVALFTLSVLVNYLRLGLCGGQRDGGGSPMSAVHDPDRLDKSGYWSVGTVDEAGLRGDGYPSPADLQRFVAGAARYIVRASQVANEKPETAGRFAYRFTLDGHGTIRTSSDYNLLRHAGTAYALGDACPPDKHELPAYCAGSRDALVRAANWLVDTAAPMGDTGAVGLWVEPPSADKPAQVRSGGVGLGIIALMLGQAARSTRVNATLLHDVGRAATDVFQQPDGTIMAYFYSDTQQVDESRSSLYYPGEVALGLLRLYDKTGNSTLRDSSIRAMQRIAALWTDPPDVCDHWFLIAMGTLHRADPSDAHIPPDVMAHARRMVRRCYWLAKQRTATNLVHSNPFGSSTEAMLNALPLLTNANDGIDREEAWDVFCVCQRTLGAAMSMQYHSQWDPRDGNRSLLDGAVANKGMVQKQGAMRRRVKFDGVFQIDTTQHVLSAVLAYLRLSSHPVFKRVICNHSIAVIDPGGNSIDIL